MSDGLKMSRRIRRTPYTNRIEKAGVREFSVVNHMLLPKAFKPTVEESYWHLRNHVQIWDVSCQRQVEIKGPDAERLIQCMTPRDIGTSKIGQCLYITITDVDGGIINDPVLLKLAGDHFWLSIADSDVLLYAKGLSIGMGLDVSVEEPDVSPLAIQGPKAEDLLAKIFGKRICDIGFFKFGWIEFAGTKQLIARSGYSRQGGFEIYLNGSHLGEPLWDMIWEKGQTFNISPGCPNLIERIEGGLFSYGNEMTRENNPLEMGLGKYCKLDGSIDFLGLKSLQKIVSDGIKRQIRGVLFEGGRCTTCSIPWPIMVGDKKVGDISSAIWSPRLEANVGLAMIDRDFWNVGQIVSVQMPENNIANGEIVELPF
ncbi:MAG: dimethylsulfoniopropionate demethylase [SAR324 cluster bacterium]|nr:dimethylsulfoniopropionate demethylase [SAR324 cluster bacterium]